MIYQKLLVGADPYFVSVGGENSFGLHCHPEMELSCCLSGAYTITLAEREYVLRPGDVALVNPMLAHKVGGGNCARLTVEVGTALLGGQLERLAELNSGSGIFSLEAAPTAVQKELWQVLQETADIYRNRPVGHSLLIKGNVYRISALLLQLFSERETENQTGNAAVRIQRALNVIYNRYYEPLCVEEVSAACGLSKSSFCRVFKSITGDTFHNTLNRHRIEIACDLLKNTNAAVEKIAEQIGFSDTKGFCRVFKQHTGKSASAYRKDIDLKR